MDERVPKGHTASQSSDQDAEPGAQGRVHTILSATEFCRLIHLRKQRKMLKKKKKKEDSKSKHNLGTVEFYVNFLLIL